jgi:hypothetical protein
LMPFAAIFEPFSRISPIFKIRRSVESRRRRVAEVKSPCLRLGATKGYLLTSDFSSGKANVHPQSKWFINVNIRKLDDFWSTNN